jgi:GH15 family glucan-1,4-alpha-glucosidase
MPLVFFTAPNDPRMLATIDAIRKPLTQGGLSAGGLVYRYDANQAPDGLPGTEGTFNICGFWLVEALTRAGRTDRHRLEEARRCLRRGSAMRITSDFTQSRRATMARRWGTSRKHLPTLG